MKPIMKSTSLAVTAFAVGLSVASFFWARAALDWRNKAELSRALTEIILDMWTVERIEGNRADEVVTASNAMLCLKLMAARATIAAAHAEEEYPNVLEAAEARVQMLLERESPETMRGYDQLLSCARKEGDVASAFPPQMARAVAAK